jgi:fatty-acid desaturase
MILLLAQIGELLKGNFNWQGVYHLFLFILMAAILGGLTVFLGYKAFKQKDK